MTYVPIETKTEFRGVMVVGDILSDGGVVAGDERGLVEEVQVEEHWGQL